MKVTDAAIAEVRSLVQPGKHFLLTCHINPDGDALGSLLALGEALEQAGARVTVYHPQGVPQYLRTLAGAERVVTSLSGDEHFDGLFVTDCGDSRLLPAGIPSSSRPWVSLDHHASTRPFADINVFDDKAAAVGVLVARVIDAFGSRLSPSMAMNIWCSLVSDTGWFRYASTDAEVLRLAARLVEAGASPWEFARDTEESWPESRITLLAEVLATLALFGEPPMRAATIEVTRHMLVSRGLDAEHTEGLVNYARRIADVDVGVLYREQAPGQYRVSLRSKGAVDVSKVARQFGGGGHRAAAGCNVAQSERLKFESIIGAALAEANLS